MEAEPEVTKHAENPKEGNEKTPKRGPKAGMLTVDQYKDRMWRRLFRTLDYVSISVSVLFIFGAGYIVEWLLIALVEFVSKGELEKNPSLARFFEATKVGLALLVIIVAAVHAIRSSVEQYRRDAQLSREDEKPHV